jgi:hypothetical protein
MPSSRATPLVPAFNGTVYPFLSLARYFHAVKPVSHIDQIGYHFIGVRSLGYLSTKLHKSLLPFLCPTPLCEPSNTSRLASNTYIILLLTHSS